MDSNNVQNDKIFYLPSSTYRPILTIKNQYFYKLGPLAKLQAIRICLRPKVDNGNNTTWLLVSLGCASGNNFTLGIIPLLSTYRPNLRIRNHYFIKLGPSATLRAIRMCLRP